MNRIGMALERWSRAIWGTRWSRWIAFLVFVYLIARLLSEA